MSQFDDALTRLNDTSLAMEVGATGDKKMLILEKVNNIKTWISSAMTDQDNCIEGVN